jgi:hypothetical protein
VFRRPECLPDVDLGAATAELANAGIGVVGGWFPPLNVGLAADKL